MPTGYTAGIVEGKIDTVEDFAKLCMRAFGATMHMREESLDVEYTPRKPERYYDMQIKECKKDIEKLKKKSLAVLKKEIIAQAKKDVNHYKAEIARVAVVRGRLERLVEQVNKLKLSKSHVRFKEFMLEQLHSTIQYDGCGEFYETKLKLAQTTLESPVDVKKYRRDAIADLNDRLKRLNKDRKADIKRCDESNKWVSDLLKVLNKSR